MHTGGAEMIKVVPIVRPDEFIALMSSQISTLALTGLTLQDIPQSIEIGLKNDKLIYLFVYADTQTHTKHQVAHYDFLSLYIGRKDGILMGWEVDFDKVPMGYVDRKESLLNDAGHRLICRVLIGLAAEKSRIAGESLASLHYMCSVEIIKHHLL